MFSLVYRPFLCQCHNYVTVLAAVKTKKKAGGKHKWWAEVTHQKCHLAVLLVSKIKISHTFKMTNCDSRLFELQYRRNFSEMKSKCC